ncbi:PVC-type heme-binding CxxCH protein [Verrucomicrobiota bacterium sgz303538]
MTSRLTSFSLGLACMAAIVQPARAQQQAALDLKPGDHIAIVGSGLADRMQNDGWLETLIYAQFPKHDLVIRNLAFSGDEVGGYTANGNKNLRLRSQDVYSSDEWLKRTKADVLLVFFGGNEAFAGEAGLPKFKEDLNAFLKETKAKDFSGKGAPRIVLLSPIAAEKHQDPNFPDPKARNENLQKYTAAMAEVAKESAVPFIDLFTPSQQLFAQAAQKGQSLTINSIHLSAEGDKALAPVIVQGLFNQPIPTGNLEKLRAAVNDKIGEWHDRYRTVDAYNIYGDRSRIGYESGKGGPKITNAELMLPEMAQRDVKTENREKRVWAIAKGSDIKVDDSNLPPVPTVGPNKEGLAPYLDPQEAISHMTVPKGCKVTLFASEKEFPQLIKPVQMEFDTKGRLWVAVWPNYPERTPTSKDGDKLLVFEDTNNDGKADKVTTFADDLNCPTGFQFYKDGVLVMRSPNLLFLRDTDGDGKADSKEYMLNHLDAADSHHETNSMVLEPGGATYLSDGVFHRTQVETPYGVMRNTDGGIYRYEPRTAKVERYTAYGYANPHGRVFDYWGNDIITDATGNANYFGPAYSGFIDFPGKHSNYKQFWNRPSRPCAGTTLLTSRHFPDSFQGNFLNCNVIGFQGIFQVKVTQDGSGLKGETIEDLVKSDDPNFRPSQVKVAPDGSIYFSDWSNQLIGHLQHHLRDPNRDHFHGRIYRMTYEGRPLLQPAKIDGQPIEALLELLKEPENDTRNRAKIELGKHDSAKVAAAVKQWAASLDKSDKNYEHNLTEALWVLQWHNVVDVDLLKRMLRSPQPEARAAATRVLCYWRDRVPDALALLKTQAEDEDPRVRLHAVRAASFFRDADVPAALDVAYTVLKRDTDYYLDYCYKETMKQLNSLTKEVVLPKDPAVLTKVVEQMSDSDLKRAPISEPVLLAKLERRSSDLVARDEAVTQLAKLHNSDRTAELISLLQRFDAKGGSGAYAADQVGKMLLFSPAPETAKARTTLVNLAQKATTAEARRAAWAAVLNADGKPETVWSETLNNGAARAAVIQAIGLVPDPGLRAKFQPLLSQVLSETQATDPVHRAALLALPLMGTQNAAANFRVLATHVREGNDRANAARAARQLPRDAWAREVAAQTTEGILGWAKTVPANKRSEQDFIETVQFGSELATLLPAADATRVRKSLRELGVSTIVLKTLHEQMRFDASRLVVEAGKPVEFIIENTDVMPHNFVIVAPGSHEAVGKLAERMSPTPDKDGRVFIPKDKKVLLASKLLEPGQKEKLTFQVPKEPGEYEYVCTYPGHYLVMWGKLIVTNDVDAYTQANPENATASAAPAAAVHEHHAH